uniref:Olfactory receptor n=1 Tax=Neogobius melanostomus TaxID=47308 RepID=A0A8C6U6Y6_9GOBI
MNISYGSTLSLDGLAQLYEHRFMFLLLFLLFYVFVMLSDSLVVYIICSQRSLHRPMYVFVGAVLVNSVVGSSNLYPKLIWDLLEGIPVVLMSRSACLCQAYVSGFVGCASFMLMAAMAIDRYLSVCHPLRYAALMSPTVVTIMLIICWLAPAFIIAGVVALASRLQPCHSRATRLFCDTYTIVSISCWGEERFISEICGLFVTTILILIPIAFVLFSYTRILVLCLQRSRTFASKALKTCLPHVIVFVNYSLSVMFELLHRRVTTSDEARRTIATNVLVLVIPTVCNPVVYGLKVGEIYQKLKKLLHCHR